MKLRLFGALGLALFSLSVRADISGGCIMDRDGVCITSQTSGSQRALDVGINVSGTQVDPRTRTWSLLNSTDSVNAVQSGAWTFGRTWNLSSGSDSVAAVQSGTWTVQPGNTANTTPWLATINQGGNSATVSASNALKVDGSAVTQPVSGTVKAQLQDNAGTAITLGQKTMASSVPAVLASDQTGINSFLDKTSTGALTALNQAVTIATNGMATVTAQVIGTFSATVVFEASLDAGVTYFSVYGIYLNTNLIPINALNSTGQLAFYVAGYTNFRVRVNAYTSGTLNVVVNAGTGSVANIATQVVRQADNMGAFITSTAINSKQRTDVNLPSGGATGSAVPFHAEYIGGKDFSGNLQALPIASIDSSNSTSAPLTANSTFTGTFVDVSNYTNLNVTVFADQVSATDGLKIEYSSDGTNIDDNDLYTIPASNGQQLSFPLPTKFYRIRYVNGVTNQGAFRLQAKLNAARSKPSSQRLGTAPNFEQDAELVITVPGRLSMTASAPTAATIAASSTTAIASNTGRKGLVFVNTSNNKMSCNAVGGTAVLNSGITLYPGGSWQMDDYTFTTAQINCIAGAASSNLAIQEFTQ